MLFKASELSGFSAKVYIWNSLLFSLFLTYLYKYIVTPSGVDVYSFKRKNTFIYNATCVSELYDLVYKSVKYQVSHQKYNESLVMGLQHGGLHNMNYSM